MFHERRIPADPTLSPARKTGGPGSIKKKKSFVKRSIIICLQKTHNKSIYRCKLLKFPQTNVNLYTLDLCYKKCFGEHQKHSFIRM